MNRLKRSSGTAGTVAIGVWQNSFQSFLIPPVSQSGGVTPESGFRSVMQAGRHAGSQDNAGPGSMQLGPQVCGDGNLHTDISASPGSHTANCPNRQN
mmetsp:Transcript_122259/g.212063  ORF Transcript_122259/g.212063 Transcript_122259/m.212063 type:complete len:97 (+) Transcript_122259:297-587(+)